MQTQAFDMSVYNQYFWLLKHSKVPFSTLSDNHLFANHFEPIILALVPIYSIFTDPIWLLIIQSLFVSLSAYPIYLMAKKYLPSQSEIFITVIGYLSSIGILYAINYDFHTSTISVLPLSWLIYFLDTKKHFLLILTSIITLTFKEDQVYFVFIVGIYLILRKNFKIGISLLLISIFANVYIYTYFSPKYILEVNQHTISSHKSNINLQTIFTDPNQILQPTEKLALPLIIYSEHLFLPLGNFFTLSVTLPHILLRLLSEKASYWQIYWHYNGNIQPFLIYGTIVALTKFKSLYFRRTIVGIIATLSILRLLQISLLPTLSNISISFETATTIKYLSLIPHNYSISTDYFTSPHVSGREKLYLCPNAPNEGADHLVIDKRLTKSPCIYILNDTYQIEFENKIVQVYRKRITQ